MSRCFPFPPPGYEKKARTNDVDLLNKNGEKISDEKKLPGKSEGHSAEKFIQKEKVRDKDRSSSSGEKKLSGHISGYNGEKIGQNCHLAEDFRDSKFVQELAGRVRDEGAGARSELVDKFTGSDRKKDEGMVSFVAKTANKLAEEKEKTKKSDDRKFNVQGMGEETRAGGNDMVSNLSAADKARVEGIPNQVENNAERHGEGKEKTKEKGDDNIRDKRKDKHREEKNLAVESKTQLESKNSTRPVRLDQPDPIHLTLNNLMSHSALPPLH
ncbi:Detected protein of confused Function [Hibiscus syriacus]|uniref:Detected protein of confused Function n=1 Tax=Hibiscus syriacus TaxID=106335 RepID=A0A6A3B579_HIBSY|nr:Detected protein of confused Function [Hibiscus syriacus]